MIYSNFLLINFFLLKLNIYVLNVDMKYCFVLLYIIEFEEDLYMAYNDNSYNEFNRRNNSYRNDYNGDYSNVVDLHPISNLGYDLSTQDKLCNLVGRDEEVKKLLKLLL